MKNEIGEYGRTNFGRIIDKFAFLTHQNGEINTNKVILIKDNKVTRDFYYFEKGEYMLKHSSNLIDIIEEGDYVNGYSVRYITDIDTGINILCNFDLNQMRWIPLKEIDVWYEVVTKEQFESISYKVKE